ncbi:hypothetical protein [Hymenobacter radiodurans]|uniref:hypothetical protein n=1 Tax=Hymenobacter radiodurans TaxID=2496028 RepID=UPI001058D3D4|nr:hypothetical protein [Hymenobacter radiodurans]
MKLSISRSALRTTGLFLAVLLYLHTEISEPLLFILQVPISAGLLLIYVILWGFGSGEVARMWRHYLGPALVAFLLSLPLMLPIYRWQNTITKRRADTIIHQVYAYQKQYGCYPNSLAQLVPRHLDKIPSTAQGLLYTRPFTYTISAANPPLNHNFWLGYYSGALVQVTYNSKTKQWHSED